MPDALSKTIPIWSAVLNRALFPSETAYHAVALPPNYLGASEEAQIESRIEGFVHSLKVRTCTCTCMCLLPLQFLFSLLNIHYSPSSKDDSEASIELTIPLNTNKNKNKTKTTEITNSDNRSP